MWFRSFTKVLHAFPIPLGNVKFYTCTRTVRILIPTKNYQFQPLVQFGSWTNKRASMFSCARSAAAGSS